MLRTASLVALVALVAHVTLPLARLGDLILPPFDEICLTTAVPLETHYDYIVVGSGSAGSVVAARLSKNATVLLLEAGGPSGTFSALTPLTVHTLQGTDIDWKFVTEPQETPGVCDFMHDQRSKWPRGKTFGGSSVLNYMMYIRGGKADYDHWKELGVHGWGWNTVLEAFKSSEGNRDIKFSPYHGVDGPLNVEHASLVTSVGQAFVQSGVKQGYKFRSDFHDSEENSGFGPCQATTGDGIRSNTFRAFVKPLLAEGKLEVVGNAHVTRVLVKDGAAYGVEWTRDGELYEVYSNNEVVLSAGTVQTPQLLMLSGIGPAEHLSEHNIDIVADVPGVGQNLQDHPMMGRLFETELQDALVEESVGSPVSLYNYMFKGDGALATAAVGPNGFVKFDGELESPYSSDVQFLSLLGVMSDDENTKNMGYINNVLKRPLPDRGFGVLTILLHPHSRGYIKLRSSNPMDAPLIQPNYYSDPRDVIAMREGVRISERIGMDPLMFSRGLAINNDICTHLRDPETLGLVGEELSDEALDCVIKATSITVYHPIGTAKMGNLENDPMAVVDSRLRVRGVKNLRCADGSVMPELVSGNTNAPIIMIGERAAAMILEDN